MAFHKQYAVAGAIGLGLLAFPTEALAARACVHDWALPGKYDVSGNFRGDSTDVTTVRLSQGCRIYFSIPGVSSGGSVKAKEQCLAFTIKLEEKNQLVAVEWCDIFAIIPWDGKTIKAKVKSQARRENRYDR